LNILGKSDTSGSEESSGDTTKRDGETSSDKKNEKEGGADEEKGVDSGPSVLSVDQSAITGESLAVDKCNFSLFLPVFTPWLTCRMQTLGTWYTTRRVPSVANAT